MSDRLASGSAASRPRFDPWTPLLLRALAGVRHGTLRLVDPRGRLHSLVGPQPGPQADLLLRRPRAARRLLLGGELGFARAWMDGDLATGDLAHLLRFALANEGALAELASGSFWLRALARLRHALRRNHRLGARRNIRAHYDLGVDFYRLWLDPTLTYSSALFAEGAEDLETAQWAKLHAVARMAGLAPDLDVLEIGCGFGSFALLAARDYGCRVTAITLSPSQFAEAKRRVQEAGLEDRITLRLQDYRDLRGQFDRIVSIEMIEAVGERYWPVYFRTLHDRLRPDGVAVLQAITLDEARFADYRRHIDFIRHFIFPGGMLPTRSILREQAESAGLVLAGERRFGADYARTLETWLARFVAAEEAIAALGFDERFRRLWRLYLVYCAVGFRDGRIDVGHYRLIRAQR
jgi:cyclopropane-fatty-acyl-phospholipid synthase